MSGDGWTDVGSSSGDGWQDVGAVATPARSPTMVPERKLGAYGPEGKPPVVNPLAGPGFLGNVAGALSEPLLNMASSAIAYPVSRAAGLATAAISPFAPPGSPAEAPDYPQQIQNRVQQAMTYEPQTTAGHYTTEYNPLALIMKHIIGPIGEKIKAPPGMDQTSPEALFRNFAGEGFNQIPQFLGRGAGAAGEAVAPAFRAGAERTMQSALKPTYEAMKTGKGKEAIGTALDEGINPSPGGVEKAGNIIQATNDRVKEIIKDSPATVDKEGVAAALQEEMDRVAKQVTPKGDLAAIQKAWDEFMDHPLLPKKEAAHTVESAVLDEKGKPFTKEVPESGTNEFPIQTAQEIKQGTYRALGNKAYGELKGADIEAQKALARSLKEAIAEKVPEVIPLNARESALLNMLSVSERRVMMEANKNPLGLGVLTTNPLHFAAWMADRSGLFKSLIARMLNQTSKTMSDMPNAAPLGALMMNPGMTAPQGPAPQR